MRKFRHPAARLLATILAVSAFWTLVWVDARAQEASSKDTLRKEAYVLPPKVIADAVLAARPEENFTLTNLSPDGEKFLITRNDGMPTVERMGRPCVHLAELAFDHTAHRAHGLYVKSSPGFDLFYYKEKRKVPVEIPEKARVSNPAWSPDGSQLAYYVHFLDSTHIYLADTTTGESRKLTKSPVLATMVTGFQWSKDGKRIQTVLLPDGAKLKQPGDEVAPGPKVRVSEGEKNPSRTFRYLLETPQDMELLEYLVTGQLAFIEVYSGKIKKVGKPALIRAVNMSPGSDTFRVATMKKPFSYYAPATTFGSQEGIWDLEGNTLYTFADKGKGTKGKADKGAPADPDKPQPPQPPVDPDGKRDLTWRPDGVGMSYLQLEPAKKDAKEARKDRVMQWLSPWSAKDVKVVYETTNRITSAQYSDDCQMLFLTQTAGNQRQVVAIDLTDPKQAPYMIYKAGAAEAEPDPGKDGKDADDEQGDGDQDGEPGASATGDDSQYVWQFEQKKGKGDKGGVAAAGGGTLLTRSNRGAAKVIRISSKGEVYLTGTDRAGGAAKPFIDKVNIKTGAKTRVFTSKADMAETIDGVNSDDFTVVFTTRQKKTSPPNTYMYELTSSRAVRLTNNEDKNAWYHDLKTERIQITRDDGFKFWAKVTVPAGNNEKLPAMFWIYPKEYTDQAAYNKSAGKGGVKGPADGKYATPGPRTITMLTLVGYAVIEPDVPIVGPAGKMNDNYVKDLKSSLKAVVEELDKRGTIDKDRLACGGHSYGAFSTANAMIHTNYFKAGIAGDGCYNRTLTPMTFQTEKRQLWKAPDTYLEMSPLLYADKMNGALLMYHGAWDTNVGTDPINSERMYQALRGLGKPTSLYMYPYEGHGPIAKETNLDLWARWVAWLDTYVMNPKRK